MDTMNDRVPSHDAQDLEAGPVSTLGHLDALPVGTRLAEFEIEGLLGVGGFGLVYRAYDTSLHRSVAIKEYMPVVLAGRSQGDDVILRSKSDSEAYAFGLQSFIDEARLLAKFDHPSLVKVYRFWEANNTAYMVMPLYKGVTLKQARQRMSAPPPEEWLRTVLWSVLQGLHVLHRSHTLHRDISPDNIFLQEVGPPVLLDLGAARRALGDHSRKMTAVLKVHYAPIEQFAEVEGLEQGAWTDLYSLAAVVYGCLSNEAPTPSTTRLVRDTLVPVRQLAATVKRLFGQSYSEEFTRTIQHALALQPVNRPQSLAAFVTEMKLQAPPRLSKFEWRAALTFPTPGIDDAPADHGFQPTVALDSNLGALEGASGLTGRGRMRWGLGLGAAVVVAALAWLLWVGPGRPGSRPAQDAGTGPLAATPAPSGPIAPPALPVVGNQPAGESAAGPASGATSGTAGARTSSLATTASTPATAPAAQGSPAAARAANAASAPGATPAHVSPSAARTAREGRDGKDARTGTTSRTSGRPGGATMPGSSGGVSGSAAGTSSTPAPSPQRESAPAPKSAPATATRPPAQPAAELCADAGFLSKPLCIHNECKKPENAALAVCVEDHKRYPE